MDDYDNDLVWTFTCHNCGIDFATNGLRLAHKRSYPFHYTTADQS